MKNFCIRLLVCVIGIMICCMSAAIFYLVDLGSDPYQVFANGVHRILNISLGTANLVMNSVIVVFMLLFKRKSVKIALFIATLFPAPFIDTSVALLQNYVNTSLPYIARLAYSLFGCMLLASGTFFYLLSNLGGSPPDSVGLMISDASGVAYKHIRIGTDVTYTIIGILLGGTFGVTTLMAVLLTGPLLGLEDKLFSKSKLVQSIRKLS